MKKIIYTIVISLLVIISFRVVTEIIFNGTQNPKSIKIDNKLIKLPKNMHLERIYSISSPEDSKDTVDLIFADDPYIIDYPESNMLMINFSNLNEDGVIVLVPSLNKSNFESFSESKAAIENNCMYATNEEKIYLLNLQTNKGYRIYSKDKSITLFLKTNICY